MKVVFCGQFLRDYVLEEYFDLLQQTVSLAGNTFYNGLLDGFAENDCAVTALSYVPEEILESCRSRSDDKIQIQYLRRAKKQLIRNVSEFIDSFRLVRSFRRNREDCMVLFNVLRISRTLGGLIASKLYRIPSIAVITDVPGYRVKNGKSSSFRFRLLDWIGRKLIGKFDYYILLSEEMCEIVPAAPGRYAVIEGLYKEDENSEQENVEKDKDFVVMYAGSLIKQYGIMNLVEAVHEIKNDRIVLEIYGKGEAETDIAAITAEDGRIRYCGTASHGEILRKERAASLLVNPRPVEDEYVKYSFPSKNMEYLASGTPALLTKLPSLPADYYPYAYLASDNSVEELKKMIQQVYDDQIKASEKAGLARQFILSQKNPKAQVKKLLGLLS